MQLLTPIQRYQPNTRDVYFVDHMRIKPANSLARNEEKQEALWKYSIDCLREFLKPDDLKRERTTVAESHIYQHDCHCHE